MDSISLSLLIDLSKRHQLSLCAFTGVEPLSDSESRLQKWQEAGFAGEMAYMNRPSDLLTQPLKLMPLARSILVFSIDYDSSPHRPLVPGFGRVARYAWGKDYHLVIREKIHLFLNELELESGLKVSSRIFSDSVPLLERALAERAGLGFIGKNTMLIQAGRGSFFFIAEALVDFEIKDDRPISLNLISHCSSCSKCLASCPTDAFDEERVLNASKCISYLSIEKRGMLTDEEMESLGEWIFGCDVCQDVCPFNHSTLKSSNSIGLEEFSSRAGIGDQLSLREVLSIRTNQEFKSRFLNTALLRAKREGLLRNA
ncbi:MAG: tRNA epoxyqueuosine(34) reductase QueG, partial [Bdellovibrionales bacterium]|nr:tRNA epoxyqueuosine(34) reductase QueG [Bdellovibrionales bacterium]